MLFNPCQKEDAPLSRMTPTIANPSGAIPPSGSRAEARKASPAATHRIRAKKWVRVRRNRIIGGVSASRSIRFGPNSVSRRATSAAVNPSGAVRKLRGASSTLSW